MSFSSQVKNELAAVENLSPCCVHAQAYGLMMFAHFSSTDISITTSSKVIEQIYIDTLRSVCGVEPVKSENGRTKKTYAVETKNQREKVFEVFGHSTKELALRINRSNIAEECCPASFIRGVFMACGTVTDPNKNYHLEFVISHKRLALDLFDFLTEIGFNPGAIERKGYHIIYFKESESIEDMLTFMGATESSLELMGIKMQKDVINRANRKVNSDLSNLVKTVAAASKQVEAIRYIESRKGLAFLPDSLREVARLRMENPEETLRELGEMMVPPLSRSGVNHRLVKILDIAEQLRTEEKAKE